MALLAEQFYPLSVAGAIMGIWPPSSEHPAPVAILEKHPPNSVGIGLDAANEILTKESTLSGGCTTPDSFYMGERSRLSRALSPVFTNRQVNIVPGMDEVARALPQDAQTTFAHAAYLSLLNASQPDAKAWKQTLLFQSGSNIDIVRKSKISSLSTANALLYALYPAYSHLNALEKDGYWSLFLHEKRILILRHHNLENTTHGGTNFIVVPHGADEHNERSSGRLHRVRPLAYNESGQPGFYPDPGFYDEPSTLLITSTDPSRRLKWFAQELRVQTRKPQSHTVDFASHRTETLHYSPDQITSSDAARITADVFNALFEDFDFTTNLLKELGLWGTVFAQNQSHEVQASLNRASATYFADNSHHRGIFSHLDSPLFADLMAIALPIPLHQFIDHPAPADRIISSTYVGEHSRRSLWARQQFEMAKVALSRIMPLTHEPSELAALEKDIKYFATQLSTSSWD